MIEFELDWLDMWLARLYFADMCTTVEDRVVYSDT